MKTQVIALFLAWHSLACVCAQSPYIHVVSDEMGFGRSHISVLMEDHQGIIWVGSELGLLRFDGLQTTLFLPEKDNPNSISNEFIYDMFEDSRHDIWIATRNGLNRLDPSRKHFTRYKYSSQDEHTLPNNRIFGLLPDTDSTFFLICDRSGLASFNMYTEQISRLNPRLHSDRNALNGVETRPLSAFKTANHKVLFGTSQGLYEYDHSANVLTDIIDETAFYTIAGKSGYFCDHEGYLWFLDATGILYQWQPGDTLVAFDSEELRSLLTSGRVQLFDYTRGKLFATVGGVNYTIDKQTGTYTRFYSQTEQEELFVVDPVSYSLEIENGIVIFGSSKGNMYMINPLQQLFKYKRVVKDRITVAGGESINDVVDDIEFRKRYISAAYDSLFYVEDLHTGNVTAFHRERFTRIAERWLLSQNGRLWLCNGTHLLEVDRRDQSTKAYWPDTPAHDLFEMIEISPGRMLVGSFREGLFWFEPDQNIFRKVPEENGWIRTQVFGLKHDPTHDVVWIGTVRNGLFQYDLVRDTFIQYIYDSENPYAIGGDWVRDIAIDSLGYAWFSTDPVGLSRFDYTAHPDSAFLNLSVGDGLPSSFIAGLGVDYSGMLWLTSLNGIARLDPRTMSITSFGKGDGLTSLRFIHGNLNITPDRMIIFGLGTGYYYIQPDSIKTNHKPPAIVLNDFLVFDESRFTQEKDGRFTPPQLNYKENYITIRFSAINYTESKLNTVRYRMEGLEDQWTVRSGITSVNYTNIPPGNYTFRIFAANNDGVWNTEETRLPIVIEPPFWQRTWFYLMLVSLIAVTFFALYRYKLNQSLRETRLLAERERVKVESEHKLLQLEMTALRAQMNPHFIFNCLNSINRFIIIDDNDAASGYLTKFSKLIRQVLDNSRGEKISLKNEIETLSLYIEMESLRFVDKFEYEIIVSPGLESVDYMIQPMLIQPYVENAIWHGLMHMKSKGRLQLRFALTNQTLHVTIEDNGIGRAASKELKQKQLVTKKSHGMKVTAERMSLLSKKLNLPVEAMIEDIYDNDHRPMGTRVTLTLPVEPLPVTESNQMHIAS